MRIVVSGRGAENMLGVVRLAVVASLREERHQVVGLDPLLHGNDAATRTESLVAALIGFEAELAVVVPSPGDLDLARLREATIALDVLTMGLHLGPTGGLAVTRLDEVPEHVTHFDLVAVPHGDAGERYRAWGRHGLIELPAAVVPVVLDDAPTAAVVSSEIVCVGDADPHNADTVRLLLDVGLDVSVVGEGWEDHADLRLRSAGRCSVAERSARLAAAALVVELPPTLAQLSEANAALEDCPLGQAALDATALGTPVVALRRPGIDQHLEIDTEVLVAERVADLPDLVRLLLSNPEELAAVGLAGQTRTRVDHRWDSRWATLLDRFWMDPPVRSEVTAGVTVIVPVRDETDPARLSETVASIHGADPSAEVMLVGIGTEDHRLALVDAANVVAIEVPGGGPDLAVIVGAARSQREWVTVTQPGQVWHRDRLTSALTLARSAGAIAVHHPVLDGTADRYDRWSAVRSNFGGSGLAPESCVIHRGALTASGLTRMLLGDPAAIADAVASGPVVRAERPMVVGAVAAGPVRPSPAITDLYPSILRTVESDRAAAAAFCELAGTVCSTEPELAVALVELALDHIGDDTAIHAALSAVVRGEPSVLWASELDRAANALGAELRALAPEPIDRVWDCDGNIVSTAQLVIDPAAVGPEVLEELVVSYLHRFTTGDPVRLVIRTTEARIEVLDWLAGVIAGAGADPALAADLVITSDVGVLGTDDLVIAADGRDPVATREVVDGWMAERQAAMHPSRAGSDR